MLSLKGLCHCWDPVLVLLPVEEVGVEVDDMNSAVEFMAHNATGGACRIHLGRMSFLSQMEPELKHFMFQLCKQGI